MSNDIIEFDVNLNRTISLNTLITSTLVIKNNIETNWNSSVFLGDKEED